MSLFHWTSCRSELQPEHRQRWRVAAEEHRGLRSPPLLPRHLDAQSQLLCGTPLSLCLTPPTHVCTSCSSSRIVCAPVQMAALPQLTVRQLAEFSSLPGRLASAAQVNRVMDHVHDQSLAAFFDHFSPAVRVGSLKLTGKIGWKMFPPPNLLKVSFISFI